MSATPRPWRWLPDEGQFIVADKDRIVAEVPCQGCNPADGEFIVRAVNSFDDLLAACKAAKAWIVNESSAPDRKVRSELVEVLESAIAKAEQP